MIKLVESSTIKGWEYNCEYAELLIYFLNESIYSYSSVPEKVVIEFDKAESKGKYFSKHIRDQYDCNRVKVATPKQKA